MPWVDRKTSKCVIDQIEAELPLEAKMTEFEAVILWI